MNDHIITNNGMIINGNIGMNQTILPIITWFPINVFGCITVPSPIEAEVAIETFEIEMAWNNLSIY
jgi:hypothetical protein